MSLAARVTRLVRATLMARIRSVNGKYAHTFYDDRDKSGETKGASEPSPYPPIDPTLAGYYANLELPYGADREAVRSARRRLLSRYHPDRFTNDSDKAQLAHELVQQLNHAHDELIKHLEGEKAHA